MKAPSASQQALLPGPLGRLQRVMLALDLRHIDRRRKQKGAFRRSELQKSRVAAHRSTIVSETCMLDAHLLNTFHIIAA